MEQEKYLYTDCQICNLSMLLSEMNFVNSDEYGILCYECLDNLLDIEP